MPDRFSVVVLSVKTPDHSHIEKYQGARLLRVPVGSGDLASRIQAFERAVRRQLESEEYALVHFTDPFGGYALCELKGDYGYRLVYEAQGFPSQDLRYTHPQLDGDRKFLSKVRREELFCLMSADRVITGSPTTRSFIHSLGVGQESVRMLRAPVDLGPYVPETLGAPDGNPMRLMYLGSQVAWQGLAGLLRGLALAVREVDVRLTLVSVPHPDWQPHLENLVAELGLKQHVEFQPPVSHDDVARVLALADVGVLPLDDVDRNYVQGGPLSKVSEYLAAGRPVLAADLPVARELVPAPACIFHPPGDAQALADHIIELARDVPRRIALGKQARAYAEQWLDAGLIRGQLLDIYDGLLGKAQGPVETTAPEVRPSGPPVAPPPIPPRPSLSTRVPSTESHPAPAPAPEPGPPRPPARPPRRVDAPRPSLSIPPRPPRARPSSYCRPIAPPTPSLGGVPASPPPLARTPSGADEPEEISEAEAEEIQEEVDSAPTLTHAHPLEELEEISGEEIHEAETPETPPREPPESGLNPWFAQLAHGYCPPEGTHFARHTPPTTMPGRDDDPIPPPAPKVQGASGGKPS
ncbi:glycosyltransferase [Archangium sp.]|uniref:glycosyltransferase n=1 Tax=Archangium sp. TaxID=1872627 RepID=UPI0039C8A635